MEYLLSLIWGALGAILWPPGIWGRLLRIALIAIGIALGFEPEIRGAIEMALSEIGIIGVQTWHYVLGVAVILIFSLAFRTAYREVSPFRFDPLLKPVRGDKTPAERFYPDSPGGNPQWRVFLSVRNIGFGSAQCVARLYLLDSSGQRQHDGQYPVALKTKANFERDDGHIGRFNLQHEPKLLFVLETTPTGGIALVHENGRTELPRGHYVFEVCIEGDQGIASTQINVLPLDDGYYISDGRNGYETALFGG